MKIYIVDQIGIHSGMHYYLQPFRKVLLKAGAGEVTVLSNYPEEGEEEAFFVNHYKGNNIAKMFGLFHNLRKLRALVRTQRENTLIILLSYGSPVDYLFARCVCRARNSMIDIHEAVAQNLDTNRLMLSLFRNLYSKRVSSVIYHSQRTKDFLDAMSFNGTGLFVPHFRYEFSKQYDLSAVGDDLKRAVKPECQNYLFFGNLNYNKGVDVFIRAVNSLSGESTRRMNFIVAGKNFDDSCYSVRVKDENMLHLVVRHITDDEMIYLFNSVQFVAMPYRKTSQSGIVEMALYFKCPVIVSDLPYFRALIEKYPSFGILSEPDPSIFADSIITASYDNMVYFRDDDLQAYAHTDEIDVFCRKFKEFSDSLLSNENSTFIRSTEKEQRL